MENKVGIHSGQMVDRKTDETQKVVLFTSVGESVFSKKEYVTSWKIRNKPEEAGTDWNIEKIVILRQKPLAQTDLPLPHLDLTTESPTTFVFENRERGRRLDPAEEPHFPKGGQDSLRSHHPTSAYVPSSALAPLPGGRLAPQFRGAPSTLGRRKVINLHSELLHLHPAASIS